MRVNTGCIRGPSEAAVLLGLDECKVATRTEDNKKTRYGVVLVAGHGIEGNVRAKVSTWKREVERLSGEQDVVDAEFLHSTIGSICSSQIEKISARNLEGIDFDGVIQAISRCRPYSTHFQQVKLGDKRNGNITLATQTRDSELGDLRWALKKASSPLESEAPEDEETANALVTLTHIGIEALRGLGVEEANKLNHWIAEHSQFNESVFFPVTEVKIVMYSRRRLERIEAPDIVLPLGEPPIMDGKELREAILNAFA